MNEPAKKKVEKTEKKVIKPKEDLSKVQADEKRQPDKERIGTNPATG